MLMVIRVDARVIRARTGWVHGAYRDSFLANAGTDRGDRWCASTFLPRAMRSKRVLSVSQHLFLPPHVVVNYQFMLLHS